MEPIALLSKSGALSTLINKIDIDKIDKMKKEITGYQDGQDRRQDKGIGEMQVLKVDLNAESQRRGDAEEEEKKEGCLN